MLFDSHAHLNFEAYEADRDDVIRRCLDTPMRVMIPSATLEESRLAVELATQHPDRLCSAVGIHPQNISDNTFDPASFEEFVRQHRHAIRAIGEVGLDYFRVDPAHREEIVSHQRAALESFLNIAERQHLPVILHCRDAYPDLLHILKRRARQITGVVHCFLGNQKQAEELLKIGFKLGCTGIITFTKDAEFLEVMRSLPLEHLLIETDSPLLAPVPVRGKRNEPVYVRYVAEKLADLRGVPVEELIAATGENARQLFGLPS